MPRKDLNQIAASITKLTTSDNPSASEILSDEQMRKKIMREMGSRGGKKGGKARKEKLSSERRKEIALKAAKARWENRQS